MLQDCNSVRTAHNSEHLLHPAAWCLGLRSQLHLETISPLIPELDNEHCRELAVLLVDLGRFFISCFTLYSETMKTFTV